MKKIISMCLFIMALMNVNAAFAASTNDNVVTWAEIVAFEAKFNELKYKEDCEINANARNLSATQREISEINLAIKYLTEGAKATGDGGYQVRPTWLIEHRGAGLPQAQAALESQKKILSGYEAKKTELGKKHQASLRLQQQIQAIKDAHRKNNPGVVSALWKTLNEMFINMGKHPEK